MTAPATAPKTISVSEIARDVHLHVGTVLRWVHQWSTQDDRVDPGGHGVAAVMPYSYLYVARAWAQERDTKVRELMRLVLREIPEDFFVVVGTESFSCYTVSQVEETINRSIERRQFPIRAYYLGDAEPTER